MKLPDVLLLGLTILFLIIGVDQMIVLGFREGYWAFMLALITFFAFNLRKTRREDRSGTPAPKKPLKKSRKS
jgi:hypothetical protein